MLNKFTAIGNLGANPEIRQLENGNKVATFSIATNENYKDKAGEWQTKTEWHNIVAWGGRADQAEKYSKGQTIYLEGKLTHRKYQDKEGNTRYVTEVVASMFRNLDKKDSVAQSMPETAAAPNGPDDNLPF